MLVLKGYIWKVGVRTENSSLQRQAPGKQPAQPLALCLSFRLISVTSLAVLPFLQPFPSHSNCCNHLIVTHLKAGDTQQAVTLITGDTRLLISCLAQNVAEFKGFPPP